MNLLWIATDEERAKALAVLKQETNLDYTTAKEWTVWFREHQPEIRAKYIVPQ